MRLMYPCRFVDDLQSTVFVPPVGTNTEHGHREVGLSVFSLSKIWENFIGIEFFENL